MRFIRIAAAVVYDDGGIGVGDDNDDGVGLIWATI